MRKKEQPIRGYKKVSDFVDGLTNSNISLEEAEEWVEDFFYTSEEENIDLIPALLKKLKEEEQNPNVVTAVTFMLEQYGDEMVLEPIIEAFKSPEINDTTRTALLTVLDYYGIDMNDPALMSYFKDIKGLSKTVLEGILELTEHGEMLETLLQEAPDFSQEVFMKMIEELGKSRDPRALPLLGIFAEHRNEDLADAAITQLGSFRSGKSIDILENLINHRKDSQELIERSLRKLQFAGITKEDLQSEIPPIYKCLLTWSDGRGSRVMMIARQKSANQLVMANIMLHEKVGIKDCFGSKEFPLEEWREVTKHLKKEFGSIEVVYSYCIQLIKDALWTALENEARISPLFSFHREIFGKDVLTPQPYLVDLSAYGLEEVRNRYEVLLAESHTLLSKPPFSDWWPDTPSSYDFVKKRKRSLKDRNLDPKITQEFLSQVLEPDRKYLARRIELTVDFLGKKNFKSYKPQIHRILAVWIALTDQKQPLERIPFMKELAMMTIYRVFSNIQMGFTEPEDYVLEY
jgi:hypothetical protein